jgi:hypothetical protein
MFGSDDFCIQEIKKRAILNKRSVGADTLRSLAFNMGASEDGVAPWM